MATIIKLGDYLMTVQEQRFEEHEEIEGFSNKGSVRTADILAVNSKF